MNLKSSIRSVLGARVTPVLFLPVALVLAGGLRAAEPAGTDFDLEIRTDKASYAHGEAVSSTAGVVARLQGIQGWSYGVEHDPAVLDLESVVGSGSALTDVDSLFQGGFDQTVIIERGGQNVGYIQAIVLSLMKPVTVPVSAYFKMAAASYTAKCETKVSTTIEYTEELGVPNSPPVEINLTIGGRSLVPSRIVGATITLCDGPPPATGLALLFDKAVTNLRADASTTLDLKVQMENRGEAAVNVLGWSYGVAIDPAKLVATAAEPGVDSKALRGGQGPEFVSYNLNEQNLAGTMSGVTLGAVIDLVAPGTNKLAIAASARRHIDTIKVRSAQRIVKPAPAQTTVVSFSDQLGGDRPVEAIATDDAGDTIALIFDDTATITLDPIDDVQPDKPLFIRGDANDDARVDIADGVWIINELFYAGRETRCKAAADANDDGKEDLADAIYIFNYQLQPGRTTSNLYPRPPAPFPNCGTADGVTFEMCPLGSTTCMK